MGFDSQSRELILDSLKVFTKRNLDFDYLLKLEAEDEVPREKILEMLDPDTLGIHLLSIPEEYGGIGASAFDAYRVCEALGRVDLGVATTVFGTFVGLDPIRVGGTPEQKEKWMTRVAGEGLLAAYAATEAQAGSDLSSITTTAEPVTGEDGGVNGYRITGTKRLISNSGIADIYLVLAKAPGGMCWFVVEKGAKGLDFGRPKEKHGIRTSPTAALILDDVIVPRENLVGGEEGLGLLQAQDVFGFSRLMVAALALGAGWRALELVVKFSRERVVSGSALSEKQAYTHKFLVPYAYRLEAARAYIEHVTSLVDGGGKDLQTEGAVAKYLSTETANRAADDAIQAMGGYGYNREYEVEKIKRDVKITTIYEGTSEILEWTVARNRWQEHLKSGGKLYEDAAGEMAELHFVHPGVGAEAAHLGLRALGRVLSECREQKLTRNQHIMFRLGELISYAEAGAVFCRSAARDRLSEAVRFEPEVWKAMSRLFARESAQRVVNDGIRLVLGSGRGDTGELAGELGLSRVLQTSTGTFEDMALVSDALLVTFKA